MGSPGQLGNSFSSLKGRFLFPWKALGWSFPPGIVPAVCGQHRKNFSEAEPSLCPTFPELGTAFQKASSVSSDDRFEWRGPGYLSVWKQEQNSLSPVNVLKRPTFHVGDKAQAPLKVRADGVETPSEFCIAAIFVGTTSVIADIQLVAALGHCWNAQVHLWKGGRKQEEENATFRPRTSGSFAHLSID
jgi:hypothetical protein